MFQGMHTCARPSVQRARARALGGWGVHVRGCVRYVYVHARGGAPARQRANAHVLLYKPAFVWAYARACALPACARVCVYTYVLTKLVVEMLSRYSTEFNQN